VLINTELHEEVHMEKQMKMSDQLDTSAIFTTRNSSGNFQTELTHYGTKPPSQAFDRTLDTVSNATVTLIFACKTLIIA
jgi:hypothetical protein